MKLTRELDPNPSGPDAAKNKRSKLKKNIDEYKHTAQSDLDHQKQHVLSLPSIIMVFFYI